MQNTRRAIQVLKAKPMHILSLDINFKQMAKPKNIGTTSKEAGIPAHRRPLVLAIDLKLKGDLSLFTGLLTSTWDLWTRWANLKRSLQFQVIKPMQHADNATLMFSLGICNDQTSQWD